MVLSMNNYRTLGASGLRVSPLALGTMTFGTEWGWGSDEATSRSIFDAYAERGGNFIDTANFYTGGTSETLLGRFMAGRRQRFVLATKYTLQMEPGNPNAGGNHRKNLVESVEASLQRLATDYIDLMWVHAWEFRTPVEEVMRALDDLVRQGKVLYAAASDTPAWKIAQANTLARLRGWTPFIATQVLYNLTERTCEFELVPMAEELGVAIQPWSPLAGGVLSGKYSRDDVTAEESQADAARHGMVKSMGFLTERNVEIAAAAGQIAGEIGATPSQVALRWLLDKPAVVAPIVGARKLSHLEDNLGALEVELSPAQTARLDELSAPDPIFPNNFGATPGFQAAVDGEEQIEGGFRDVYCR